jgi:hypothetical protein
LILLVSIAPKHRGMNSASRRAARLIANSRSSSTSLGDREPGS